MSNVKEHPFQIYFINVKGGGSVWEHPTLGPLPDPWQFCLLKNEHGEAEPQYYNTVTQEIIKEDPRYHPDTLKARRNSKTAMTNEARIASSIVKNSPGLMSKLKRVPVGTNVSLRDHYERVHTIDPGDGTIGASKSSEVISVMIRALTCIGSEWRCIRRQSQGLSSTLRREEIQTQRRTPRGACKKGDRPTTSLPSWFFDNVLCCMSHYHPCIDILLIAFRVLWTRRPESAPPMSNFAIEAH